MVGILQGKARGGEEESILMHDLKPFRILISLLDKPELGNVLVYMWMQQVNMFTFKPYSAWLSAGPAILEDVLIEVYRTLHTQCRTELDLQNQSPFSKDHTHLSRWVNDASFASVSAFYVITSLFLIWCIFFLPMITKTSFWWRLVGSLVKYMSVFASILLISLFMFDILQTVIYI